VRTLKVITQGAPLPAPVVIGGDGASVKVPNKNIEIYDK
jgi:hypothetical protein